jgi:hypothetical protein
MQRQRCLFWIIERPNPRSALEARTALCLHIEAYRPGTSESDSLVPK